MKITIKLFILTLLICLLGLSCDKRNTFKKIDSYYKGDISFPIDGKLFSSRYFKYIDKLNCFYYLDKNSKTLLNYSNKGILLDSINLNDFDNIDDFFILSKDSLYLSMENKNKLLLINNVGAILQEYNFKPWDTSLPPFFTYNYINFPLEIHENLVFTYHYLEEETSAENIAGYFAHPRELVFSLTDSVYLKYKTGKFPDNYIKETYSEMNPYRTFGKNDDIIYSFEASDSIFIYNSECKLTKSLDLKTKYFNKNKPLDESTINKESYFDELTNYVVENDRYSKMIYNKNKYQYYRTLKKGQPYKNNDGTKNQVEDCQWLLLIYDENFNLINTFEIKPSVFEVYTSMLANDNNILIPYLNKTNETTFAVFNFYQ